MSRIDARYSTFTKVALTLSAAIIPMVVGLGLTLDLAKRSLHSENTRVGSEAVVRLDHILDQASQTAQSLMHHADVPCETAHRLLHRAVAANPWVAAVSLDAEGVPYCTSLDCADDAPIDWPAITSASSNGSSWRLDVSDDLGYLVLSRAEGTRGVSVMLDNRLVLQQLELISGTVEVALKVGGVYLWDDGSTLRGELNDNPSYFALTHSTDYDYAIHSILSGEDVLRLTRNRIITVLGPISMLSILSAGLCYWALTRPRRTTQS
jgi:hypothetical protein